MDPQLNERLYDLRTLGCKANLFDSQLIEAELRRRGWKAVARGEGKQDEEARSPQLCIVNSCTVTDEADRQSRRIAARLARENPGATVVVTGCAAEIDPERLASSQGVSYVIGNCDKPRLVELILEKLGEKPVKKTIVRGEVLGAARSYAEIASRHPIDREWPLRQEVFPDAPSRSTRAFLKVQEGCDAFCSYCIIPYGRGPSRSLEPGEAVRQVRELVLQGVREVVVTGTNIGDYGTDWADRAMHVELFERILSETSLERLRLSSLNPLEIPPALLDLMRSEPRLCPHFHVSLQSPHPRILKLMKRSYRFEQVSSCLESIARLPAPLGGVFVGMDVITGFPGETREEFEWGVETLSRLSWSRLHVFPFSERSGTPATRLPGALPRDERVRRARMLNQLSLARMRAHHERIFAHCGEKGSLLENVLLEQPGKLPAGLVEAGKARNAYSEQARERFPDSELWQAGYTPNYLRVFVPRHGPRNECVSVRPEAVWVDERGADVAFLGSVA